MIGTVNALIALVGFAFVSSITPGPNNVLLWASGATFGIRRSVPHVLGTAVGLGVMALAVAAGLGALVIANPALGVAMKVAGSAYLLYLAIQIARAGTLARPDIARPLGLVRAAGFQLLNPKAWIFALGAITTFRPPDLPLEVGSALVAGTMMAVIVPSALVWAAGGGFLNRLIASPRAGRALELVLATIVALTVIEVWR